MTTAPLCPRCKRPISAKTAATMTPGSVALHAACSHAASEEAWRRITVRPLPAELTWAPRGEPTRRLVGVRHYGGREVIAAGLAPMRAHWERLRRMELVRHARRGRGDVTLARFAAVVDEPE